MRKVMEKYSPNPEPLACLQAVLGIAILTFIYVFFDHLSSPEISDEIRWWKPAYLWVGVGAGVLSLARGVLDKIIHIYRKDDES